MCKGIAILINDKNVIMNEKTNSHSELRKEDDYLKINCIYDDTTKEGYKFEVDNHSKEQLKEYKRLGYLDDKNEIIPSYKKRLYTFCKKNEHKFFKLFCKYLQSSTIKGDIIIYNMKNGDKETQDLLNRFSEEKQEDCTKATFNNFVKWLLKNK